MDSSISRSHFDLAVPNHGASSERRMGDHLSDLEAFHEHHRHGPRTAGATSPAWNGVWGGVGAMDHPLGCRAGSAPPCPAELAETTSTSKWKVRPPSNVLVWRVPVGSLYLLCLRAVPSDPRARAIPVRGPLRASRAHSAAPTAVAHHDAIPSTRQEVLGSSGLGLEESGPEPVLVRRSPTVRSSSARNTIRHPGTPNTDGHRRTRSREYSARGRRAGPESPRTAEVPVTESRYRPALVHGHAQGRVS